jgi:hypothetical protein
MAPDKLRWLADALEEALRYADISLAGADAMTKAAAYLRACADAVPVAWIGGDGHPKHISHLQTATDKRIYGAWHPLYAAPVAQPLTDEQIELCISDWSCTGWGSRIGEVVRIARAVERAVKGQP